ncbi:aromatic-ring-hydroxylating dioxygenase subunit beta [Phenylobacterium sp. J367]|uniref:aromatic-ring-hydroxylating dioxygenase subunit beta n=1 Tax=Phenylobacterium sp. J367 TaxID=2898435 RepID=UPI0021517DBA|nr:aromatic-ring-hydroxylating dioxygenase subunit beta [Phenylobacterium sp. J367]MCR5879860.1 nuclear transport factor 2 family protein [Phenylobacterium sp. J367]
MSVELKEQERGHERRALIEAFVYREARLADEHRYDEWESLWADEATYWVPIGDEPDPSTRLSYIFDNRSRLASRIRQLKTGRRHSQAPQSRLARVISNIELEDGAGGDVSVRSNFILIESRRGAMITWAGRTQLRLVRVGGWVQDRRQDRSSREQHGSDHQPGLPDLKPGIFRRG